MLWNVWSRDDVIVIHNMMSLSSRLWLLSHTCFWGWHNNDNDFNQQPTHVFELWVKGTGTRNPKSFKFHCRLHWAAVTLDHLHLHCRPPSSSRFFASYFPIPFDISFRYQSTMIKPSMTWRTPSNWKRWMISKISTLTNSSYTRCSCLLHGMQLLAYFLLVARTTDSR